MKVNNDYTTTILNCQALPLKNYNQWVLWRTEDRNGKVAKIPYQANGYKAKTNDPKTWTSYENAVKIYQTGNYTGLGFVFTDSDDFVFIDLDNCFDKTGGLNGHTKLVESFVEGGAFVEKSISGQGLHIIIRAKLANSFVDRKQGLEIYTNGRFVALTGDIYAYGNDIGNCQNIINSLCKTKIKTVVEKPVGKVVERPEIPLPLINQDNLPYSFWEKLNWLKTATKGQSYMSYRSRSEVEFSCLLSLVKYGKDYNDASRLFEAMKPRHYIEQGKHKYTYLKNSWNDAVSNFINTPNRKLLVEYFNNLDPLKLATDMNVLRGIYISAYMNGEFECSIDQRTLTLVSGVSCRKTVRNSIKRLIVEGYIEKLPTKDGLRSDCYKVTQVSPSMSTHPLSLTWGVLGTFAKLFKEIGGSSQQVYLTLEENSQTVKSIATKINKSPKTVRRALKTLEYYSLAVGNGRLWSIGNADTEDVIKLLGIDEAVDEHKKKIKAEREYDLEKYQIWKKHQTWKSSLNTNKNNAIIGEKEIK